MSWHTGFWRAKEGNISVMVAVGIPVIVALTLGIIDYGLAGKYRLQVAEAANTGVQYAAVNGWGHHTIDDAVRSASSLPVDVSSRSYCGCSNNSTIAAQSCSTYCSNGDMVGKYVEVSTHFTHQPLFPGAWTNVNRDGVISLDAIAVTRIE